MTYYEMNIYEFIMMVAFGSSWPFAVIKTFRTKKIEGKSIVFLIFIFTGYVSGTIYKLTTNSDAVLALYIFNGSMVFTEIVLTLMYDRVLRYKIIGFVCGLKGEFFSKSILKQYPF